MKSTKALLTVILAGFLSHLESQIVPYSYEYLTQQFNLSQPPSILQKLLSGFIAVVVSFLLIYIIIRYSRRFELFLLKIYHHKETFTYTIFKQKIDLKNLLSAVIYSYNGIKLITIISIVIYCIRHILHLAGIHEYWDFKPIITGLFKAIVLTILAYYLLKLVKHLLLKLYHIFNNLKPRILDKMQYNTFSFISEEKLIEIAKHGVKLLHFVFSIIIIYFFITLLFSFFSITSTWAEVLFSYITSPIFSAIKAFFNYLPNVFIILVILFIIKYILKLIRLIFKAIESKSFTIPGFYTDWAIPTYNIVRFLVIVFAFIVIFPYLPGSESPFFRGITVFVGILFSLGSTSAISNVIAGVVLTYMRPFKIGDRVKIAETLGDIMEKSLLVTRVRTAKNVDITVPNAMVLSSHIINYSSSSLESALIVHTNVTVSYNEDWRYVHKLLIEAALTGEYILKDPVPFILQTALDDFYVKYELNAYTKHPEKMTLIYSQLHQGVQDVFKRENIDLVSPMYASVRTPKD